MSIINSSGNKRKIITIILNSQLLIGTLVSSFFAGCKKFVDVNPPYTQLASDNVYQENATAAAVLTGLYFRISSTSSTSLDGFPSLSFLAGLSSDELHLWNGVTDDKLIAYYQNALFSTSPSSAGTEMWNSVYFQYMYTCNAAINGLNSSNSLTPSVKQQLLGEAKFMRALGYFYLVNLYGDVPLVLTTDYKTNLSIARSSETKVYDQIIADLTEAKNLLSTNFLAGNITSNSSDRIRPTKWAANALLARVYLYKGDWANAEAQASEVINNTTLFSMPSLNNVFLKNSKEAIWQLQPVYAGYNTEAARLFIIPSTGFDEFTNFLYLEDTLYNSFESGDARLTAWIGTYTDGTNTYHYPYKYKENILDQPVTEYLMVLRLAEQYLIRAEARAKLNNISGAKSDLNVIRTRAGLPNTTAGDQGSLLTAILKERQVELFTEWGHRWLDLKRTGKADALMAVIAPIKGGTWSPFKKLWPIPYSEIIGNPNLTQNAGY